VQYCDVARSAAIHRYSIAEVLGGVIDAGLRLAHRLFDGPMAMAL
jgi:hypothetical protein